MIVIVEIAPAPSVPAIVIVPPTFVVACDVNIAILPPITVALALNTAIEPAAVLVPTVKPPVLSVADIEFVEEPVASNDLINISPAVKHKIIISSPVECVKINLLVSLLTTSAVIPVVPETAFIASFIPVKSDIEETATEIAASAKPESFAGSPFPSVKVTVPVASNPPNLALVIAVAVTPVLAVAVLTAAAASAADPY
jgi:hypothetical protein